jgi:Protein of unknown function (DUF3892)
MLCAAPAFHTDVDHERAIVQMAVTARMQIDCVTIDEKMDAYQRIVRVGGPNLPGVPPPDTSRIVAELRRRGLAFKEGPRWTLSTDEAIEGILSGKWSFYIQLGIYEVVNLQLATSPTGRFYLKTEADQDTPDELLFLPRCR